MAAPRKFPARTGFTLFELLAAMSVLVLLVLAISTITGAASNLLTYDNKHMDAYGQARTVFDCMANDFARICKRPDADDIFWKGTGTSTSSGINDALYFYTEASGYFDSTTFVAQGIPPGATASSEQNEYTLIGYRVNTSSSSADYNELERLGLPLSWDGGNYAVNANHKHGGPTFAMPFLTYPAAGTYDSNNSDVSSALASSTIGYNFSAQVGTEGGNYADGSDTTFSVIGSQVFRMELAYQLKDGTLSDKPIMTASPNNGVPSSTVTATACPIYSNDSTTSLTTAAVSGYASVAVGSRWWDKTNQIGYVCVDATPSYAVWHQVGMQDVEAVIVTIAVIDRQGQLSATKQSTKSSSVLARTAALLPDYVTGQDPAYLLNPGKTTSWAYALLPGNAVDKMAAPRLPLEMISQIRIFQRSFYLNE